MPSSLFYTSDHCQSKPDFYCLSVEQLLECRQRAESSLTGTRGKVITRLGLQALPPAKSAGSHPGDAGWWIGHCERRTRARGEEG